MSLKVELDLSVELEIVHNSVVLIRHHEKLCSASNFPRNQLNSSLNVATAFGGRIMSSSISNSTSNSGKSRWHFSEHQLKHTPSVRTGQINLEKELSYRQQAANFIQDMGQRLEVTQLCINTAIVYMQRFYMFHSFTRFHRNSIASAALFLAAKVEEQPRKLEHVIKVAHMCLHRGAPQLDTRSDAYMEQAQELVTNENILLQTLGFDVAIDHPHTHVVKCCQLVRAAKDLAQTSYFMATNSLHLTTMCLRFSPTIVACVCIHLACKWSNYKIPLSAQNKEWFTYIDNEATQDLLDRLTEEFLAIFEKCPSRLKKKIMSQAQDTKDVEEKRMKQGLRAHEFNLTTGDNTTQPQGRPPGGTGVPDAHHRSRHHGSHHGHSHHSRTNSSSSSTSTSSTAPVVNNANAHGHHMPTSSTKHMQHPNSASNKHIDQRHHRQDRPDGKSHSNKSIPPMMNNQSVVGTSNQPPPPSQSMVPQQQQPTFSNNYQVDQFGRPIKPPHNSRSTQQQHRGHPTQPHHSNRPSQQQQQPQQQQQAWQQQQQQTADPQHRGRPDMSLFNQQQPKPQQRPHQPPQNQQNSRHSLPNDWTMRSQQQQRPSHQPPPLPPSDPPKPQPPPPPLPLMGVDKKPPRSIFDIDSPPPTTMNTSTSSLSMSLSNPVKMEMGDIFENETDQQTDQTKPKSGRDISPSVVKLNKVENMTGFEKLRDGRPSIKVPHNQIKQEVKQEFMPDPNSMVVSIAPPELTHLEDSQHHHSSKKHKKEKKNKKEKKDKKDREKSERYSLNSNGEMVKTKHKSKHKEKDRDREHATASSSSSGLKLKIKPVPIPQSASSTAVDSTGTSGQQDIKIKLLVPPNPAAGHHHSANKSNKRHRQHSDSSDSSTGTGSLGSTSAPATKMSRVLGTSVEQESTFLNERIGNQYGIAKNSRKVPTK